MHTNKLFIFRHSMCIVIFASQGLRFGSPFSPPLADLEYILRICALIFHWLRLPVHISNQKTFYTEHMLSTKCKQKMALECSHMITICHFPFWFQWKRLSRLPKLWNFHLVDSKGFQIKLITNKFFFTGPAIFNSPTYV